MLKISNLKMRIDDNDYASKISQVLNIPKRDIKDLKIIKKSVDARHNQVSFLYTIGFNYLDEASLLNKKNISVVKEYKYDKISQTKDNILIVGSGPAGLFCAYNLVRSGNKVTLIEQGNSVEKRVKDKDEFLNEGKLNSSSNIQFGEGGAGTFSDGKLTSGIKDFRTRFVLETFHSFGANEDILYLNKPHIGTDVLVSVVKNIREYLIDNGATVLFNHHLDSINIKDNKIESVVINNKQYQYDKVVLAIGHSARDTYKMLDNKGVKMVPKAFAVGFRIEHLQEFINKSQYGKYYKDKHLPTADYKLAVKTNSQRGVYSFCMCPGGEVVNASSEENRLCVNGMSNYQRDSQNANSAILVTVTPDDFKDKSTLGGVSFQRELEEKAFKLGGSDYSVPVQRIEDYLNNSLDLSVGKVKPSVKRYKMANLNELFDDSLNDSLHEGLTKMNNKIRDFTREAVILGVESRSSSPVRFERNVNMESNIQGLYPIGEGAGYAGGIMSAAIDGLKCSEEVVKS
ncbi:MAG: FAD-dependent oxidoreductase [Thomasclavelia sp.]|nr:FAD-dependent oxidoreductase [Thomasclavelia sp.]